MLWGEPGSFSWKGQLPYSGDKTRETYDILFADTKPCVQEEQSYHTDISYVSHLGRRVFCGKDRYTDTVKMIDSFLFDYYMANDRYHNMTIYKFSFGVPKNEMRRIEGRTLYAPQKKIEKEFLKLTGDMEYCTEQGIGFLGESDRGKRHRQRKCTAAGLCERQ